LKIQVFFSTAAQILIPIEEKKIKICTQKISLKERKIEKTPFFVENINLLKSK
jgi:hypothetical protein